MYFSSVTKSAAPSAPQPPLDLATPERAGIQADSASSVLAQQTQSLYTQAPLALIGAFAVAVVTTSVLWDIAPRHELIVWFLSIAVLTVLRLGLVFAYKHFAPSTEASRNWATGYSLGSLLSGCVWGASALLLDFSWPSQYQVLLIFSLAGVTAGAIVSNAAIYWTYVFFELPALAPLAIVFLVRADHVHYPMGVLVILYSAGLLATARGQYQTLKKSLVLYNENLGLVASLTRTNAQLASEVEHKQQALEEIQREQRVFVDGPVVAFRWRATDGWPVEHVSRNVDQLGLDAEQLMHEGTRFIHLIHPDDRARVIHSDFAVSAASGMQYIEQDYRLLTTDGSVRWVYDYTIPVPNEKGDIEYYDGYLIDITARKATENALIEEKERAQVTLRSIGDGVITTDHDDRVVFMNEVAERLTGWKLPEARYRSVNEVFNLVDESAPIPGLEEHRHRGDGRFFHLLGGQRLCRRDGACFYGKSSHSMLTGGHGEKLGSVIVFRDTTEARMLAERLSYQATHDSLTGLLNRGEFEWVIELALQSVRKNGGTHCVCYVDLDRFKIVNDTCGHLAGDALLKQLAAGLPGLLRDTDVVARLGGDEFGILLEDCSADDAQAIVAKVHQFIKNSRFLWDNEFLKVGASVGIVEITPQSESVSTILNDADAACYVAKEHGRDQININSGRR